MTKLDITAEIIDLRDIIERIEDLETELDGEIPDGTTWQGSDEMAERDMLFAIMAELAGNGGDEQWRGDWYPITLIRDSYFQDYAQELAEDIGAIDPKATWPLNCIDWEQAARELRIDYSAVDIEGVTYWYR